MLQLSSSAPGKGFWARHRWKMLLSLGVGVAGAGYAAYRFYDAHQRQLVRVEQRQLEEQAADELVKNQLQAHFENVQRISDTTTLPFAMHYLRSRIMEELDISHLTEKLLQGKGESGLLTTKEKLDTWLVDCVFCISPASIKAWTGIQVIDFFVSVFRAVIRFHQDGVFDVGDDVELIC